MFEDERCEVIGGGRVFDGVDVIGLFMTCTRLVSSVCAGAEARRRVRSATSSGGTLNVGDIVLSPSVCVEQVFWDDGVCLKMNMDPWAKSSAYDSRCSSVRASSLLSRIDNNLSDPICQQVPDERLPLLSTLREVHVDRLDLLHQAQQTSKLIDEHLFC